jgi:F-type H+-transporting ATPase subunit b
MRAFFTGCPVFLPIRTSVMPQAWAQTPPPPPTTTHAEVGHETKKGLPQLNPADFAPQLVWLALTFIALYVIMSRIALPRVGSVLEERASRIASDLNAAARLREDTQKAIADYEKALADAKASAQQIAREARDDMTADMNRERAQIDRLIGDKSANAEKSIKVLKESATGHIEEIAAQTAEAVVARILSKPADVSETRRAVKEALGK